MPSVLHRWDSDELWWQLDQKARVDWSPEHNNKGIYQSLSLSLFLTLSLSLPVEMNKTFRPYFLSIDLSLFLALFLSFFNSCPFYILVSCEADRHAMTTGNETVSWTQTVLCFSYFIDIFWFSLSLEFAGSRGNKNLHLNWTSRQRMLWLGWMAG